MSISVNTSARRSLPTSKAFTLAAYPSYPPTRTHHSDPHKLLSRTAHAAEVHPQLPSVIVITGGYGVDPTTNNFDMLNDIVLLDTQR